MEQAASQQSLKSEDLTQAYLFSLYRKDPVFFVEHALGHMTWSKQREILESVRDNELTAVRACHGASKTFTAAEIAVWFFNIFPDSKVITSAPTHSQVELLLWSEINNIYKNSRIQLEGKCLTTQIKSEDDSTHFSIGFSTDKPARAEGWHAPAILFILDEAKGIQQWLYDSIRGVMTGGFCRWLVISTTDGVEVGEQYYEIFKNQESKWNRIHISAFDTPYVTGERFECIDVDHGNICKFKRKYVDPKDIIIQIASPKYIDNCRDDWGEDSVLYVTKVLGEISDKAADTIIKLSQTERMFQNHASDSVPAEGAEECGVDVARGGSDDTVFFRRRGLKIVDQKSIATPDLPPKAMLVYIADELERFVDYRKIPYGPKDPTAIKIKIDDTGVGGGLTDIMQDRRYDVLPINFGSNASDPDKYPDIISEMWFQVAPICHDISCEKNNRLQTELTNRKFGLDKKGRREVESKKKYKERGKGKWRSPDMADAFLLCFYTPAVQSGAFMTSETSMQ